MVSIHAMKGAEIGEAFDNAGKRGSQVHDEILLRDGTGELAAADKPGRWVGRRYHHWRTDCGAGGDETDFDHSEGNAIRLIWQPDRPKSTTYERSDFCALPRAIPIGEAMMALVLLDALLEKIGGDSLDEMRPRFDTLRRARLQDLPMDNVEWRFGYD